LDGRYGRKREYVSELELTHYRLTKREEKRLVLEETEGDYLLNLAPNQAVLLVLFIDVLWTSHRAWCWSDEGDWSV
jgi:hypothetical protein